MSEETIIHLLEAKEALYFELQTLLDEESRLLGSPDFELTQLWTFTEEKNRLSMEIEALRGKIVQMAATRLGLSHPKTIHLRELPRLYPEEEPNISRCVETLIFVKGKIRKVAESSISFVESYLDTVEEVIGMLTQSTQDNRIYGVDRHLMEPRGSVLIHGEA